MALLCLLVPCRKDSPDGESDQHADGRSQQEESSAEPVEKGSACASDDPIINLKAAINKILRFGIGDASVDEHESEI